MLLMYNISSRYTFQDSIYTKSSISKQRNKSLITTNRQTHKYYSVSVVTQIMCEYIYIYVNQKHYMYYIHLHQMSHRIVLHRKTTMLIILPSDITFPVIFSSNINILYRIKKYVM